MKKLLIFVLVIFISGCGSEINGSSAVKWLSSIMEIAKENNKPQEQLLFWGALSRILMLSYAENNPTFNKMEYQNMSKNNAEELTRELSNNPVVMMDIMKKIDGMDYGDVIEAGNDANEKLMKLLSERPNVAIKRGQDVTNLNSEAEQKQLTGGESVDIPPASSPAAPAEQPQPITTPLLTSVPDKTATETPPQAAAEAPATATSTPEQLELAKYKAKDAIDEANKQINVVWNATTKPIRKTLLPEQKAWLKQREDDCGLKASTEEPNNSVVQETIKFTCMATMTNERTQHLKDEIENIEGI